MVVTRRPPAPPVPASRTNSAQPIPRVKAKATQNIPDVSSPLSNGLSASDPSRSAQESGSTDDQIHLPSKKGKGKGKGKDKKGKNKRAKGKVTFLELLTRIFLLWFTIYTLSVCPDDAKLESRVCRGLYEYRRQFLEPYLLPPLSRALSHPAVAPYVDRAKPFIVYGIDTAKPAALRLHSEWMTRVVPQWNKRVVPQWNKHVVPQLEQHVYPQVSRVTDQVMPYVTSAETEYERRVGPYVRTAVVNLHAWQQHARPYVVLAAHKTYDGYERAKPYAAPALQQIKVLLTRLLRFLAGQRRQYVDPHVQKIWERVKELSNGESAEPLGTTEKAFVSSVSDTSPPSVSIPTDIASRLVPEPSEAVLGSATAKVLEAITPSESLPSVSPTTNPIATLKDHVREDPSTPNIQSTISIVTEDAIPSAASVASTVADAVTSSASSIISAGSSVILDDTVPSAVSKARESIVTPAAAFTEEVSSIASQASSAATSLLSDVASSATDIASASVSAVDEVTGTAGSVPVPSASNQEPEEVDSADDLDLDSFYAELGLNGLQDILQDEAEAYDENVADPATDLESAEEKAEKLRLRKEETARKRADITARHAKWEIELEDRIARARKELRSFLVSTRKAAVTGLKESTEIRKEVEGLVEEAEKYLRGAEKYMGNLRRESRSDDEKKTIWDRVIEKVDKKFEERLSQTEAVVNGWYLNIVEKELAEVQRLAREVKDLADRAQADIGLDYAWLDDVTYNDWRRYHELDHRSENFTAQALSIQNGTHPSPPINPVLPAIEDLQNEVQDVVVGFETRLRRIKRNGERAFGAAAETSDGSDAHDDQPDETVSILPIEDGAQRGPEVVDSPATPPVFIGRSKEEIMSVLDRVAEQEAQATSAPTDNQVEPQQVVANLAQEAVEEGHLRTSAPPHEEL